MKEEKVIGNQTDPVRRGQILSTISTVGLIVLMIAYLFMTVIGHERFRRERQPGMTPLTFSGGPQ